MWSATPRRREILLEMRGYYARRVRGFFFSDFERTTGSCTDGRYTIKVSELRRADLSKVWRDDNHLRILRQQRYFRQRRMEEHPETYDAPAKVSGRRCHCRARA